jgi:microcystin-dependent protein
MFAGSFAPAGWAFCDGQLLPISENETLFALIGTTYGGDGQETFALPDLRGRIPIHQGGAGHVIGESAGTETVTLTAQQIPVHVHPLGSTTAAFLGDPGGNLPGAVPSQAIYREGGVAVPMAAAASGPVGGGQPHENLMPYLCVSFIISLFGIFPSPS